jgi:hypothetical protein
MPYSIKDLIYLFVPICAFKMYAVGYEVYDRSQFSLMDVHSTVYKRKLINFIRYNLKVYI